MLRPYFEELSHEKTGELRCPRCDDDITVCHCPPGQSRPIYNISRVFRAAEAQRLLPILRHRFSEGVVQQAARQGFSYAADVNRQRPQTRLLYDIEPPTHDSVVLRTRRFCHALWDLQKRRIQLLDQGDELGRTQWSAVSIIGSYLKFDAVSKPIRFRHQRPLRTQTGSSSPRIQGSHSASGIYNALLSWMTA